MTYFAHSENQHGKRHPLPEHLACVGRMAEGFAGDARWSAEARLAGLVHDLGKYGDLFQRRLEGKEKGLDHWSAGAWRSSGLLELLGDESGASVLRSITQRNIHDDPKGSKP